METYVADSMLKVNVSIKITIERKETTIGYPNLQYLGQS